MTIIARVDHSLHDFIAGDTLEKVLEYAKAEGCDRLLIDGVDYRLKADGTWEALDHE